jgi:hypothetical protein
MLLMLYNVHTYLHVPTYLVVDMTVPYRQKAL